IDLQPFLGMNAGNGSHGRSLVAHVQGDEFWLLAHGWLQRLELRLGDPNGPRAVALWRKPLSLGSPLHVSQVEESPNGSSLYLVTQPLNRPICLSSAIDPDAQDDEASGEDNRLRWQRQLGFVCQGDPVVLGTGTAEAEVVALDQSSGFFR